MVMTMNYQYDRWEIYRFKDGSAWLGPRGYRKGTMTPLGFWMSERMFEVSWRLSRGASIWTILNVLWNDRNKR